MWCTMYYKYPFEFAVDGCKYAHLFVNSIEITCILVFMKVAADAVIIVDQPEKRRNPFFYEYIQLNNRNVTYLIRCALFY